MSSDHVRALARLCRVCGRGSCLGKRKKGARTRQYPCAESKDDLLETYGIDTSNDAYTIHPQSFCHPCYNIIYFSKKAKKEGKEYNPKTVVATTWSEHSEVNCTICEDYTSHAFGGRPHKNTYTPGRPKNSSALSALRHIRSVAPPSLGQRDALTHRGNSFECPICQEVLQRPMELTKCGSVVCAECLCQWLREPREQWSACPCCYSVHLDDLESIKPASDIVLKALGCMEVSCALCSKRGLMKNHKAHVDSNCQSGDFTPAPIDASQLLSRPPDQPLSPLEERVQSSLIKRSMHSGSTLHVKTGGQVNTLI